MKVLSLEIVNNKAIGHFYVKADGGNIEVAGNTGTGKTTAVSALWDILSKGKDTLTHGESHGKISVTVGDDNTKYIAERVNTPKTSSVTITKVIDDKQLPIDMKDFEAMLSKLSVNPHQIAGMKPTERVKTLLAAADIDIDLDALDAEIAEAEEDRKLAGRAAKASKPVEVPEPVESVSVAGLVACRDEMMERNKKKTDFAEKLSAVKERKDEVTKELAKLESELLELDEKIENGDKYVKNNPLESTEELSEQIATADETNAKAAVYEQAKKDHDNHVMLQAMHKESDDKVKELRQQKKEALDGAQWPLDGISVEDGAITYHGTLFENLGESEQILVTAAIALGDIEKHPMKVVRLDGVESMSADDYGQLRELFNGRGIQVLSTRVARGDVEQHEIEIVNGNYGGEDE